MKNFFKNAYYWLIGLKKYHAIHILIILPIAPMLLAYIVLIGNELAFGTDDILSLLLIGLFWILTYLSIILAIIITFILFLISLIRKQKIYVKSDFLLHSKVYNVIYFLFIIHYLMLFYFLIFVKNGGIAYAYYLHIEPIELLRSFLLRGI